MADTDDAVLHPDSDAECSSQPPDPKRARLSDGEPFVIPLIAPLSQSDNTRSHSASPYRGRPSTVSLDLGTPRTRCRTREAKSIHDRVHDHISLPALLVAVIDTPEFQRLRSLKQLGACQFLFPGATHTRFEHSIGVAHLAGTMARHLQSQRREVAPQTEEARRAQQLDDERDVLCVMLAGLTHDLGHGPFSHMFELFVRGARNFKWCHEDASVKMLRHLIEANKIDLESYSLTDKDLNFVTRLIRGLKPTDEWPADIGRTPNKRYLFDIVANKRNGIDVDKLDYFLRDSLSCYGKVPCDCPIMRIIKCSQICDVEVDLDQEEAQTRTPPSRTSRTTRHTQICFEEKVALSLGDIFTLRARNHKYIYQHHVVKICDQMILDILTKADPHFRVAGTNGKLYRLSETVDDMAAFARVGDWVLDAIEASADENLQPAQELLRRFRSRDLYPLLAHAELTDQNRADSAEQERQIHRSILESLPPNARSQFRDEDLVVTVYEINYGSSDSTKAANPLLHVSLVNPKRAPNKPFQVDQSRLCPLFTPTAFHVRQAVICTRLLKNDDRVRELRAAVAQGCSGSLIATDASVSYPATPPSSHTAH